VPPKLGEVAGHCALDLLSRIEKIIPESATVESDAIPSRIEHLRSHVRTKRYWHKGQALAGDHDYYAQDDEMPDDSQLSLL
jgi:DNA (cytosine-5)-methyltransferase 1